MEWFVWNGIKTAKPWFPRDGLFCSYVAQIVLLFSDFTCRTVSCTFPAIHSPSSSCRISVRQGEKVIRQEISNISIFFLFVNGRTRRDLASMCTGGVLKSPLGQRKSRGQKITVCGLVEAILIFIIAKFHCLILITSR